MVRVLSSGDREAPQARVGSVAARNCESLEARRSGWRIILRRASRPAADIMPARSAHRRKPLPVSMGGAAVAASAACTFASVQADKMKLSTRFCVMSEKPTRMPNVSLVVLATTGAARIPFAVLLSPYHLSG